MYLHELWINRSLGGRGFFRHLKTRLFYYRSAASDGLRPFFIVALDKETCDLLPWYVHLKKDCLEFCLVSNPEKNQHENPNQLIIIHMYIKKRSIKIFLYYSNTNYLSKIGPKTMPSLKWYL